MPGYLLGRGEELEVAPVSQTGPSGGEALTCPAPPLWGSGFLRIWTP